MQPQAEHQTTSMTDKNISDDGTYLQTITPHPPSNNHSNVDNNETPYLELDESAMQPQAGHQTTSKADNNIKDGTNLQPTIPHSLSDGHGEYEYVHYPDASLTDEKPYMDLDASSRQPTSVYQEMTNPKNLKLSDTYLALDPNSRHIETEYQAIDTRGQDSGPT